MEATLSSYGEPPPQVRTREVDKSFTTFIVERGHDEIRAFIDSGEYVLFGEELLRAGMEFLRLARERAEYDQPQKEAEECPTTPRSC